MKRPGRGACALAAAGLMLHAAGAPASQLPVRPDDLPPPAAGPAADPCAGRSADTAPYVPRLLRVVVNGSDTREDFFFLQRRCGALLVRAADLERLRIISAGKPSVEVNGDRYLNLNAYDGLTYALDEATQRLAIEGEPRVFHPTVIDMEHDRVPQPSIAPGGFLNYGLFTTDRLQGGTRNWTGSATLGLFGEPGVMVSDWLHFRQGDFAQTLRLGTTFHRDFPERIASLRIGDVFSRGGAFGGTASIGGVQYATNFATRPYLITGPVEMMDAATARLAMVDLFNSETESPERQARAAFLSGLATAPHGPVEIVNIPTYQNGEYVLVLRDAQGREQVVRRPFFFSQGLLRQGLHDFSYELGARRQTLADDRYGDAFASATHRYGIHQRLTGEAHVEAADDGVALGVTASSVVPRWGVLTLTGAASQSEALDGLGAFVAAGLENSYVDYGWALRTECRDERFALPSAGGAASPVACRSFGSVSRAVTPLDSISLTAAHTQLRGDAARRNYRLGFVSRRWRGLTLATFASYAERPVEDFSFGLLASASLATLRELAGTPASEIGAAPRSLADPRRVNFQVTADAGQDREPMAVGRVSSGARIEQQDLGVQATAGLLNRDLQTLSGSWGNRYLTSAAGLSRAEGDEYYTAGAASGVAWLDGGWFPTRPLTTSFAAVRLGPDYPGVRINGYTTDADGDVLLTPMQPYQANPVAINGADLPMNARFDALTLFVTPAYRAGAVLRPRIEILRDAILTVQVPGPDGQPVPLPPGGWATVPGSSELFPVGDGGAVYVLGLQAPQSQVDIHWDSYSCRIDLTLPAQPPRDAIPELGPFLCEDPKP